MVVRLSFRITVVTGAVLLFLLLQQSYTRFRTSSPLHENTVSTAEDGVWPVSEDKVVVVPRTTGEDTDWVAADLPE
jgi:hypothetical protein